MEVKLVVIEGKGKGREIPLPASQFIIGRSSRCHLRPHSEQVSKVHCAIGRKPGNRVVVRDMKSRNKTYINGMPISGTITVNDGDILGIGPLQFRFAIDVETPAQPLHEDHVLWLMDEGDNTFDVESSSDTTVINLPPDLMQENEGEETATRLNSPKSEHGLSAGQYLLDQVRRAEQPAPATAVEPSPLETIALEGKAVAFVDQLAAGMQREFSTTVPIRNEIVHTLIEAIADLNLDPTTIKSLDDLKKAIAAIRN